MKTFKKSFITGLVILLPIAVTLLVVTFIINFLTKPFVGTIEQFFIGLPFYAKHRALVHLFLQIFSLIGLIFFTVLLGFLARVVFFRWILSVYDYIVHRIPVIKTVYKAAQQMVRSIFGSSTRSFKQVVMIPFPTHGAYCIGLVSGDAPAYCEKAVGSRLVSVFVPTTPNPTSGYLIMYREEEVVFLDMRVEEAFKYIISCGVISSEEPLDLFAASDEE